MEHGKEKAAVLRADRVKEFLRPNSLTISLLLLFVYIIAVGTYKPSFFALSNWLSIVRSVSTVGIMASALTFVMLTGSVDLSCGSLLSLTGCISCSLIDRSPLLAVLVPLLVGALCGALNGFLVGKIKINSFVTTLGMLSVYQAITFFYTNGQYFSSTSTGWYREIGQGFLWGIPIPALLFFAVILFCSFLQKRTVFGAHLYAVGCNPVTARFTGISPVKTLIEVYLIGGIGVAFGAIVLCSRSMASQPQMGVGYEFDVLTAVVVGGLTMSGGRGGAWGTLFGVLLIGIIKNSLVILGVSTDLQYIAQGLVLFAAIAAQTIGVRRERQ